MYDNLFLVSNSHYFTVLAQSLKKSQKPAYIKRGRSHTNVKATERVIGGDECLGLKDTKISRTFKIKATLKRNLISNSPCFRNVLLIVSSCLEYSSLPRGDKEGIHAT